MLTNHSVSFSRSARSCQTQGSYAPPILAPHTAGKYKLVTFAHKELNLYKVFWEVQARGGYQAVCRTKQWKVRGVIANPQTLVNPEDHRGVQARDGSLAKFAAKPGYFPA